MNCPFHIIHAVHPGFTNSYQHQQRHSSVYYVFYNWFAPTYFSAVAIPRELTPMLLNHT